VVIEPGMAFGTGTHATTQLCLRLAEQHLRDGATVLDVGTGSGILCIAAVKLGARFALGFDNDPDILENAAENLKLNDVADGRVQIFVGGIDAVRPGHFDLILCNMLSNQFLPVVGQIASLMAPQGLAVFSGFLVSETDEVTQALAEAKLEPIVMETLDEWGGLVAKRSRSL
jgi:ribosomal protein L11 methyltransferase